MRGSFSAYALRLTALLSWLRTTAARVVVAATLGSAILFVQTPGLAGVLHLRPLGLNIFTTYCSAKWEVDRLLEVFSADNTDVPVIVAGRSRDGSADHAVVVMNGKIVHDPSGAGMVAPCACSCSDPSCEVERWYWIDVICVDSSWTERRPG